jgi:hypothetical protein
VLLQVVELCLQTFGLTVAAGQFLLECGIFGLSDFEDVFDGAESFGKVLYGGVGGF